MAKRAPTAMGGPAATAVVHSCMAGGGWSMVLRSDVYRLHGVRGAETAVATFVRSIRDR